MHKASLGGNCSLHLKVPCQDRQEGTSSHRAVLLKDSWLSQMPFSVSLLYRQSAAARALNQDEVRIELR